MTDLGYAGEVTLALGVTDRAASRSWYEQKLGFEVLYEADAIGWTAMRTPVEGLTLGLSEIRDARPGGPVPTLDVGDLASARRALEGQGVRFDAENVVHEGLVRLATFYDPDGHAWMLAESLA